LAAVDIYVVIYNVCSDHVMMIDS